MNKVNNKNHITSLPQTDSGCEGDPLWFKDAIIYEVHVKAFFDSNDDGIGDFKGLTAKLDYLQDLGVNTLWLLPFYPSPFFLFETLTSGFLILFWEDLYT